VEPLQSQISKHSQSKLQRTIAKLSEGIKLKGSGAQQSHRTIQPKSLLPVKKGRVSSLCICERQGIPPPFATAAQKTYKMRTIWRS